MNHLKTNLSKKTKLNKALSADAKGRAAEAQRWPDQLI